MSAGLPSAPVECIRCTGFIARTAASAPPVCDDCAPRPAPVLDRDEFTAANRDPTADHENPVDVLDVADAERAAMLRAYLDAAADLFAPDGPLLMPLDAEGKAPIIRSEACGLDDGGQAFLHTPEEAVTAIREDGARGFALYAGKQTHGTADAVFVDHDDMDALAEADTGDPTLVVRSGSGRGIHESYRNAGDVENGRNDAGEVRARNWYVVTPGSVHPTGGVYHPEHVREVAPLCTEDLPASLRPATPSGGVKRGTETESDAPTCSTNSRTPTPGLPDDVDVRERLELALDSDDTLRHLWNGNYDAAGYPDDRSKAEHELARRLGWWFGNEKGRVKRLMDEAATQKWCTRPDTAYRDSTLRGVEKNTDCYRPPSDAEPVSALPLARLAALDPKERRRAARKRGFDWPTTATARDRLHDRLMQAIHDGEHAVVVAPTALGKSHTVSTTPWLDYADVTDEKPLVQFAPTRKARDENAAKSRDAGVTAAVLKGRDELCPVCRGDHDPAPPDSDRENPEQVVTVNGQPASEWIRDQCVKGLPLSMVHAVLRDRMDQFEDLPCEADGTECLTKAQWDGVPRGEDSQPTVDVIHATSEFARVPSLRSHTNVVFDEQPDFTTYAYPGGEDDALTLDRLRQAITAFLRETSEGSSTFEEFVTYCRGIADEADPYNEHASPQARTDKEAYDAARAATQHTPDRDWYLDHPHAHVLARPVVRALWHALTEEADANGRAAATVPFEPPRFDEDTHDMEGWNREWLTVVVDANNTIRRIRSTPDFSAARAVIGLDAFPCMSLWQRNTVPDIQPVHVLDADERRLWRRFERGLTVVQVGDNTNPYASGEYFNETKTAAIIDHLHAEFGEDFRTCITAASVEGEHGRCMRDVGIDNPATMHFGEEKSRNDFGDERVGLVNGSIDPGDEYVLDTLAEMDLDARPERADSENAACTPCSGEGCHQCNGTGQKRARGRGFVGPDADTAAAVLASVRENHVAQAAGRYARAPDDLSDHAVVFVRTDAIPRGFADMQVPGVTWTYGEKQRAIVKALRKQVRGVTARELAAEADSEVTPEHVRQTLHKLAAHDCVTVRPAAGPHGATLWQWARTSVPGPGDRGPHGTVDLGGDQITNSPVLSSSTWALAITTPAPPSVLETGTRQGSLSPSCTKVDTPPPD